MTNAIVMTAKPKVSYFLYSHDHPVDENDSAWHAPLPQERSGPDPAGKQRETSPVTIKDYFPAARSFLAKNRFAVVVRSAGRHLGCDVTPDRLEAIDICLVKHGAFYHPARVDVRMPGQCLAFVLNAAFNAAGKTCMQTEYALLKKLNRKVQKGDLPAVYGRGTAGRTSGGPRFEFFLGEWFTGFHEFHLSVDPRDNRCKIGVWDDRKGLVFLTDAEAESLYCRVARILTRYYNPQTFEHIASWHHAAGDFVVRKRGRSIDTRLITVREYRPLFACRSTDAATILNALLVFFLNLSIRNRLDRIDGVGEIGWAGDIAVSGTVKGFFDALKAGTGVTGIPASLAGGFRAYLASLSESDLLDLLCDIVGRYPPQLPEVAVIRGQLKAHAASLRRALAAG